MAPRLDAVGIVVKDMAASLRFYRLLGLSFPEDAVGEDHVEATAPNGLRVMLDALEMVKGFMPDWTEPTGHRMGLAFACGSAAEVDPAFADITGAGFSSKTAPWDDIWGQRYAQVLDPDGNVVDLFAPL